MSWLPILLQILSGGRDRLVEDAARDKNVQARLPRLKNRSPNRLGPSVPVVGSPSAFLLAIECQDPGAKRGGHGLRLEADLAQVAGGGNLVADEEEVGDAAAGTERPRAVARRAAVVEDAGDGDEFSSAARNPVASTTASNSAALPSANRRRRVSVRRATPGLTVISPRLMAAMVPTSMSGMRRLSLIAEIGPIAGRGNP